VTPTEAAIAVANTAANVTSFSTSFNRGSEISKSSERLNKKPATTALDALPNPIAIDAKVGTGLRKLTRSSDRDSRGDLDAPDQHCRDGYTRCGPDG
jgi:hypothetical protein